MRKITARNIKIVNTEVILWERKGFFGSVHIHQEKISWDNSEIALMRILSPLIRKERLTMAASKIICKAMAKSHRNASNAFNNRRQTAELLDLDRLIYQLL